MKYRGHILIQYVSSFKLKGFNMFTVTKTMEIAVGHCLDLPYDSPCQRQHGHNIRVEVTVSAEELTEYGMVVDFGKIKEIVHRLDHQYLNDKIRMNPTAENLAVWIVSELNMMLVTDRYPNDTQVTKVVVQESEGNVACWYVK